MGASWYFKMIQPFGSIPRASSSLRKIRFIHVAKDVSPSFFISASSWRRNSSVNLIGN
ncbi:hypothetical protein PTE_00909 [Photorhabdus khanii NC19]|uniref:Uncharacterized protein n=1 Tax=Photorhabdus khanii NC19 TaxID=1004151 RepID=W3VAH7_9GAMM|nr:hypothetical protein PTE_00909 [Photorhabdus khanii NC19]